MVLGVSCRLDTQPLVGGGVLPLGGTVQARLLVLLEK